MYDPAAQQSIYVVNNFPHKYVWVQKPLLKNSMAIKVRGPYEVVGVDYPVIYIKVENTTQSINVDRCKPAYLLKDKALHAEMLPEMEMVQRENIKLLEEPMEDKVEADKISRTIGELDKPYKNTRSRAKRNQAKATANLLPDIFLDRCDDGSK